MKTHLAAVSAGAGRTRGRRVAATVLALAVAAAVGGCVGGRGGEPAGDTSPSYVFSDDRIYELPPAVGAPEGWSRREPGPSDADYGVPYGRNGMLVPGISDLVGPSERESHEIGLARYLGVKKCMEDRGFTYDSPPPSNMSKTPEPPILWQDEVIGLVDPMQAEVSGYHTPDYVHAYYEELDRVQVGGTEPIRDEVFDTALYDSDDSCYNEVDTALRGGNPEPEATIPPELTNALVPLATADPIVAAAIKDWSECMRQRGYDLTTPPEAAVRWMEAGPEGPVSEAEIEAARADMACKEQTNLIPLYRAAAWRLTNDHLLSVLPTIEAVRAETDTELRAAADIIAKLG
jgi:hypothetical protein